MQNDATRMVPPSHVPNNRAYVWLWLTIVLEHAKTQKWWETRRVPCDDGNSSTVLECLETNQTVWPFVLKFNPFKLTVKPLHKWHFSNMFRSFFNVWDRLLPQRHHHAIQYNPTYKFLQLCPAAGEQVTNFSNGSKTFRKIALSWGNNTGICASRGYYRSLRKKKTTLIFIGVFCNFI